MLPTNSDSIGCSPISSKCVIWQGKDLPCINLCKGDSVSTVVYKVAVELCEIMDELNISNYDMECFGLGNCGPDDFKALIQLLIDKVCALESIDSSSSSSSEGEGIYTEVSVAKRFYTKDSAGDDVTHMPLVDYVEVIGRTVSNLIDTINEDESQISLLDERVTALEDKEEAEQESIYVDSCLLGTSYPINEAYEQLDCDYLEEKNAVGDKSDVSKLISKFTKLGYEYTLSDSSVKYNQSSKWNQASTLVDSLNNAWVIVEDCMSVLSNYIAANPLKPSIGISMVAMEYSTAQEQSELLIQFKGVALQAATIENYNLYVSNYDITGSITGKILDKLTIQKGEMSRYLEQGESYVLLKEDCPNTSFDTSKSIYLKIEAVIKSGSKTTVEPGTYYWEVKQLFGTVTTTTSGFTALKINVENQPEDGTLFLYNEDKSIEISSKDLIASTGIETYTFSGLDMGTYYYRLFVNGIYTDYAVAKTQIYESSITLTTTSNTAEIDDYNYEGATISASDMKNFIDNLND